MHLTLRACYTLDFPQDVHQRSWEDVALHFIYMFCPPLMLLLTMRWLAYSASNSISCICSNPCCVMDNYVYVCPCPAFMVNSRENNKFELL